MRQIEINDEWLKKYTKLLDKSIIQELEMHTKTDHCFSKKFDKKMKRLIRYEEFPGIQIVDKVVKRIAIFFVCMISATFLFGMSVEAYRTKIIQIVKTFWQDAVKYSFFLDVENDDFRLTRPRYIPENYLELEVIENDISVIVVYENATGAQIVWEQRKIIDNSHIVFDTEYDSMQIKEINGAVVTLLEYEDGYRMAYYEQDRYLYLITADYLASEEIYKILASMYE